MKIYSYKGRLFKASSKDEVMRLLNIPYTSKKRREIKKIALTLRKLGKRQPKGVIPL